MPIRLQGRALNAAITFSCASCYLLFGYDQGVLGGLVTQPSFLDAIGRPSAIYLGTIVALYNIGCLAGCVVAAIWGDRFGRRPTILCGSAIMIVGGIIQASCYGAPQLIVGRLISGLGNGMNTSTIPVYVAETSRTKRRGTMVAVQLSAVIFGTVVAYWLDYGTTKHLKGEVVWRFPIAFQIVFLLITVGTLIFLPDTPRWLFSHGRKAESVDVLSRLLNLPPDSPEVQEVEAEMEESWNLEQANGGFKWSQLLKENTEVKNLRRLVIAFMIYFFQMFTGINVIAFYVTIVLEVNVGLARETSSLVAGCIQIAFWLGTFPPMFYLDKFGRRKTLMAGGAVLATCMVIFTISLAINTPATSKLALAVLFIFEIAFGMSWNSVPWIYAAEVTPLNIRHIGAATGAFSEWLFTFVIVEITPVAIQNIGWRFYILFCVMIVLAILFVFFFVPETANKSLEEIDYLFCDKDLLPRTKEPFEIQTADEKPAIYGSTQERIESSKSLDHRM